MHEIRPFSCAEVFTLFLCSASLPSASPTRKLTGFPLSSRTRVAALVLVSTRQVDVQVRGGDGNATRRRYHRSHASGRFEQLTRRTFSADAGDLVGHVSTFHDPLLSQVIVLEEP